MINIIVNIDNLEQRVIIEKTNDHDEELEIVSFMENTPPQSVVNLNEAIKQLNVSVKAIFQQRRPLDIYNDCHF